MLVAWRHRVGGSAGTVTYGYDAANRLTSVTGWDSNVITYGYDDANRMTTKTLPSGTDIVSTYAYDDADRLTGISHVKSGITTLASVAYTLDDVGNRTQRVDQQGTHTYVYDDLYRLIEVTYPGPSTTEYTFDAFGNRESMTDGSGTTDYTYDDADRLTEVDPPAASPVTWTWDDNGNLTDRGSDEFAWDEADRMVSATVNSVVTTFAYRGDGLRYSWTTVAGTTTFTWDVNAGLPVVLHDGNYYLYGGALEAMEQGGDWYYYLEDGLGSTMAVVDDAGAVQNSYTYDVYGTPSVSGSLPNEYDFAGQNTDASTGLQYLRARYMDPDTGVFLSRDPLAAEPTWLGSLYGYAAANPSNLSDPTGLCAWWNFGCQIMEWLQGQTGLNDSEWAYCHRGPSTAQLCRESLNSANAAVETVASVFGDRDDDETAAFRHCLWSGFMVCDFGSGQAKIFGDLHEDYEGNPINNKSLALHNNRVGRFIGEYFRGRANATELIAEECLRALSDGRLFTSRHIFDENAWDGVLQ